MDVHETKIYRGYWWLPNNPSVTISGNLCIDINKGIELETIGSLLSEQEIFDAGYDSSPYEILLGKTVDGKAITLIDWHHSNSSFTYSNSPLDLSVALYRAKFAIVGKRHFIKKDEIKFTSAEVRFSLLDEWLSITGFNLPKEVSEGNIQFWQIYLLRLALESRSYSLMRYAFFKLGGSDKFYLEYSSPEKITFRIDYINTHFSTNYFFKIHQSYLNWQLKQKSFLKLIPDNSQSINWYMKQFYSLQKLLTVMTGFPVEQIVFLGYGNDIQIDKNAKTKEIFEIYLRTHSNFKDSIEKSPTQLLFTVPCLSTQLSLVVNNWFKKSEILDPVINLYVATLSTHLVYAEFQLLNYAQALEAFHLRVIGGKYMSDVEYESICNILTKQIPPEINKDHQQSLKNRLKYGNYFSQRKRIKELLEEVWDDCLNKFINNKTRFIEEVISTRNYLIHYDESSASKAVVGNEIFYLAQRLKVLLLTHILIQIGIPKYNVYKAIKRFEPFNYLKSRN
ncbi:MAG: hypothetical protein QNJ51_18205 [Calothrix sp. MO_167.B12]|nr:hypothetical protein [Calothrix sp. MO_167.B12]